MNRNRRVNRVLGVSLLACFASTQISHAATRSVSFVGKTENQTDFQALGFGQSGYYFPQFDTSSPVTERPVGENAAYDPPNWISIQFGPFPIPTRSFSLDAGCFSGNIPECNTGPNDPLVFGVYSKGGQADWDDITLPNGVTGLSGAFVDEFATNNSNNSVNRIQLGAGTPSSFLLHIVTDNTNQEHDSAGRLNPRGADAGDSMSPGVNLTGPPLTFDGTTDVYTFRYDNYVAGDFVKLRLNSGVNGEAPSIGGIMFDAIPEPSCAVLLLSGTLLCGGSFRRRF